MAFKKNYHHGNLRKQLIETALDIIAVDGLEKMSMRGLCSRIGVSRTAPYRHFANKSELLSAIAEEGYCKLTQVLNSVNTRGTDEALTRLMGIGIAYVEFAVSNPAHYRIMFGNEIQGSSRTPSLLEAAGTSFNELVTAVRICRDEKKIKPFDPIVVANTLWATAHGISTLLIDGQVPMENSFQVLPALLQNENKEAAPNIHQIFKAMGQIIFTGLLDE